MSALAQRCGGVGETRAIHMHGEPVLVGKIGERAQFGGRINRPEFGGLRQRQRARFRKMHAMAACQRRREIGGPEFRVRRGDRKHLAAAGEKFRCAAFVVLHVRELVANDAVMPLAIAASASALAAVPLNTRKTSHAVSKTAAKSFSPAWNGRRRRSSARGRVGGGEGGEDLRAKARGVVARERVVG